MMFVMEHYYDRVPLFVFPEICIKNSGISPRELFYTYYENIKIGLKNFVGIDPIKSIRNGKSF